MIEKIFQKDEVLFINFYFFFKILVVYISSYLAFLLRFNDFELIELYIFPTSIIAVINFFLETYGNKNVFYNKKYKSIFLEFIYFLLAITFVISISAILKTTSTYSRIWIGFFIIFYFLISFLYKYLFNIIYSNLLNSNAFTKNVLLIGDFDQCKKLVNKFRDSEKYHIRLIAIKRLSKESSLFPIQCVALNEKIYESINFFEISQIWILNDGRINLSNLIEFFDEVPIDIRTVIPETLHKEKYISNINNYNFYETNMSPFTGIKYFFKIFIDKFLSLIFLIIAIPIIILASLFLLIEDGFPIFFIQKRHGWDGKIIKIYKLRSLKKNSNSNFKQVAKGDDRVLKTGKIIRRLSIDELPQLINILEGKLSLVGPRPHPIDLNNQYTKSVKGFMQRHRCKPGLTGLAQVNGFRGPTNDPKLMIERYNLDRKYIQNWNLFLDLKIIIKTLFVFLFQKVD